MATFDVLDDNFEDIFLTQNSKDTNYVSLEEEGNMPVEYNTVKVPEYSDISDFEDDAFEDKIRYVYKNKL